MMQIRFHTFTLLAAAVLALAGLSSAASAAESSPTQDAPYAAQATSLGLTPAQADRLQARVGREVQKTGGTQVAVNEVRYDGGATVLTLPGQKRARPLSTGLTAGRTINRCPSGYFCTYTESDYKGSMHMLYHCNTYYATPYAWESYVNNQTEGVKARFYYGHEFYGFSRAAVSSEPYFPLGNEITSVMPCYHP